MLSSPCEEEGVGVELLLAPHAIRAMTVGVGRFVRVNGDSKNDGG